MSETKFTPGPWETDNYAVRSEGPNGRQIALCEISVRGRPYDETYPEALSNATLIAAAPDLYEALLDALFCMDGVADGDFARDGDTVKAAMATARAALLKARGA